MKKALLAGLLIIGLYSLVSYKSPAFDPTEYYWFDAYTDEYIVQCTIEQRMFDTQYNEGTYAPFTAREVGYAPANVIDIPPADPQHYQWFADKVLYSHP